MLLRNRTVLGIDWGIWAMRHAAEQQAMLDDLLAMVEEGTLDPVHPARYPSRTWPGRWTTSWGGGRSGKIALIP